jgi:hypothetical protein
MSAVDYIVIAVVAVIVGLAVNKIVRDRKRGVKCSGCGECGDCSDKPKE